MKAAHQTEARAGPENKAINVSNFAHVDVRKYHAAIDPKRYLNDSDSLNYAANDYFEQNDDLKRFYEEYAKQPPLKPIITHPEIMKIYLIKLFDVRRQVDLVKAIKFNHSENIEVIWLIDMFTLDLFSSLIRSGELKKVSEAITTSTIDVVKLCQR